MIILDPIFVENFPYYPLSDAQQSIFNQVAYADKAFLLISRQVGKSNLLSYIFWYRIINYGKVGESYLTLSPKSGDVEKLMLADILTEAFGGAKLVYDLNSVYIKPPSSWLDPIMDEHELKLQDGEQSQSLWSIYLKSGLIKIDNNEIYETYYLNNLN